MKALKAILVASMAMTWGSGALFAQSETMDAATVDSYVMEIDEATMETMVVANNFDYKRAKAGYDVNLRAAQSVWNEFLPSINANLGFTNNKTFPVSQSPAPAFDGKWRATAGVSATLNLSAWVEMSVLKTLSDYNAGKMGFAAARQQVLDGSRGTFYALILSRESLEVNKSAVDLALNTYRQSERNFRNGMTQRLDMMNSQVSYANAKAAYDSALTTYNGQILTFKQMLGIPVDQEIHLNGNITVAAGRFDSDELLSRYLGSSYTIKQAQAALWSERWGLYQNHLGLLNPYLKLNYEAAKNVNDINSAFWRDQSRWGNTFGLTLGVSLNVDGLLPWSKTGLNLRAARDQYKLNKLGLENDMVSNKISVINAVNKLNDVQSHMEALETAASVSQQALEMTLSGWRQGVRQYLEVQASINDRNTAQINLLQGKYDYYSALLDLSRATGADLKTLQSTASPIDTQ